MNLLNFVSPTGMRLGLEDSGTVLDIESAALALDCDAPRTWQDLVADPELSLQQLKTLSNHSDLSPGHYLAFDQLELGPAVLNPGKILCVGLNYRRHAAESNMPVPCEPVLFSKFSNSLAAHGQKVSISGLHQVDYEAELGVIIGKRACNVDEGSALSHVLGYCNANDLSDRELQFRSGQWLLGKSLNDFLPVGPWVRIADADFDPQNLQIRGWMNGEIRQDSHTSDMIFSVAEIIAYVSRWIPLDPGDLLITGTPEGVILGTESKKWMQAGDDYEV